MNLSVPLLINQGPLPLMVIILHIYVYTYVYMYVYVKKLLGDCPSIAIFQNAAPHAMVQIATQRVQVHNIRGFWFRKPYHT